MTAAEAEKFAGEYAVEVGVGLLYMLYLTEYALVLVPGRRESLLFIQHDVTRGL